MNLEILIIRVAKPNEKSNKINNTVESIKLKELEITVQTNSRTFMFSNYLLFLGWNDWISTYILTSPNYKY